MSLREEWGAGGFGWTKQLISWTAVVFSRYFPEDGSVRGTSLIAALSLAAAHTSTDQSANATNALALSAAARWYSSAAAAPMCRCCCYCTSLTADGAFGKSRHGLLGVIRIRSLANHMMGRRYSKDLSCSP
ncbi:hypothetical protein SRHO_G00228360 [Serrasalmus rhombeus]